MRDSKELTVNNLQVINKLFLLNLKYIKDYSENVYVSLELNWKKFIDEKNGNNKRDTAFEKLCKCIEKVKKIENKKINRRLLMQIKEANKSLVEEIDNYALKKSIENKIETFNSLSDYFEYYLYLCSKELKKMKSRPKVLKKEKIDLPKIKTEVKKIENVIELPKIKKQEKKYFTQVNNYLYANIDYTNNVMAIDIELFNKEVKEYWKNVKNDSSVFSNEDINGKLAPFEKRRRVYIQNMYVLDKNMYWLSKKDIDITFPVDKVFECSKIFVDSLYKELLDYSKTNKILDSLMEMTVKEYGIFNKLDSYDSFINGILLKISHVDKIIYSEIKASVFSLKNSVRYLEFKDIEGLFPSKQDLLYVVNKKIVNNVYNNFEVFYNNFAVIVKCTYFMSVDDVVKFYNNLKEMINRNIRFNLSVGNKKYIELQELIAKIIEKKNKMNSREIVEKILKEEILF